jgi:KUP system potassium uptake protein
MTAEPLRKGGANAATEASHAAPAEASAPAAPREPPTGASGFFAAVRPHRQVREERPSGRRLAGLSLIALGIVYGDIGTSPLYALRQCFDPEYGLEASQLNVYGVLSLIVWMLIIVVSIKYIVFIMRADNRGEGGILALLALLLQQERRVADRRRRWLLISLGLFGASLLYGDGIITPAISVLGAVEGVQVVHPHLPESVIVVVALMILLGLFVFQRFGTARIGVMFGPIMAIWFVTIAALGVNEIAREPRVLLALNPWYGLQFFAANGKTGFLVLGAVVLAVTGAEALYADMGHFGKRPIRLAWFGLVFPALLLNYFGQGAIVLRDPSTATNPFFLLAPSSLLWPLVVIATIAAVIASQALISGAFSLTQQSVQLGYSPRVTIVHTSHSQVGQIYIPEINNALMVGCLLLVVAFRNSTALGDHVDSVLRRCALAMELVARARWHAHGRISVRRHFVAPRERDQVRARRLGAHRDRHRRVHAHEHVEERTRYAQRSPARRLVATEPLPRRCRTPQAASRFGHGRVHDVLRRRRAGGTAAPSQAQQGAARAGGVDVDSHRGSAGGR